MLDVHPPVACILAPSDELQRLWLQMRRSVLADMGVERVRESGGGEQGEKKKALHQARILGQTRPADQPLFTAAPQVMRKPPKTKRSGNQME